MVPAGAWPCPQLPVLEDAGAPGPSASSSDGGQCPTSRGAAQLQGWFAGISFFRLCVPPKAHTSRQTCLCLEEPAWLWGASKLAGCEAESQRPALEEKLELWPRPVGPRGGQECVLRAA